MANIGVNFIDEPKTYTISKWRRDPKWTILIANDATQQPSLNAVARSNLYMQLMPMPKGRIGVPADCQDVIESFLVRQGWQLRRFR